MNIELFKEKFSKLDLIDISFDGIDYNDYPDFCDAYICEASWEDGTELTHDEIDILNDDYSDYVYEKVIDYIF